jgi:hypothetical protein
MRHRRSDLLYGGNGAGCVGLSFLLAKPPSTSHDLVMKLRTLSTTYFYRLLGRSAAFLISLDPVGISQLGLVAEQVEKVKACRGTRP